MIGDGAIWTTPILDFAPACIRSAGDWFKEVSPNHELNGQLKASRWQRCSRDGGRGTRACNAARLVLQRRFPGPIRGPDRAKSSHLERLRRRGSGWPHAAACAFRRVDDALHQSPDAIEFCQKPRPAQREAARASGCRAARLDVVAPVRTSPTALPRPTAPFNYCSAAGCPGVLRALRRAMRSRR